MPVNPELLGRVFPSDGPYLVGREKVREFARAVFADAPIHTDVQAAQAAGYDDVVAPPTFATVIQQQALQRLLAEPGTGIELKRTIHAEQRFAYARPVVAGDELASELTVTGLRSLGGNTMITAETRSVDRAGAEVITATSVLLIGAEDADE